MRIVLKRIAEGKYPMGAHLSEELVERYSEGTLLGQQVAAVEEHLLICEACQHKLSATDDQVRAMRAAAARLRTAEESGGKLGGFWAWPRLVPALAAALLLVLGVALALRFTERSHLAPIAVTLEATRGLPLQAMVPAGTPLLLKPGLAGLPVYSEYRLEIVDSVGNRVSEETFDPQTGPRARTMHSGSYFVRVYAPSGTLLREYGLEVALKR